MLMLLNNEITLLPTNVTSIEPNGHEQRHVLSVIASEQVPVGSSKQSQKKQAQKKFIYVLTTKVPPIGVCVDCSL
jgi:hypothetical protein